MLPKSEILTTKTGAIHRQVIAVVLGTVLALEYGQLIGWVSSTLRLLQSPQTPSSAPFSDLVISVMASLLSLTYMIMCTGTMPALEYGQLIGWVSSTLRFLQSPQIPSSAPLSDLMISVMASVLSLTYRVMCAGTMLALECGHLLGWVSSTLRLLQSPQIPSSAPLSDLVISVMASVLSLTYMVMCAGTMPALEYGQLIGWVSSTLRLLQSPQTPSSAPFSDLVISVMASVLSLTYMVMCAGTMPALEYGQLIGWVSSTLRLLQSPQTPSSAPLSDLVISVMASVLSLGAAVGTPCFSYAADRFGRKPTILTLSLIYFISWTLKLVSPEATSLILARVLAGFASGGLFLVLPIYVREVCQDSVRGALGSLVMVSYNIGVILIYLFGIYLSYSHSLIACMAICLSHLVLFSFMPETPVYCVKKKRYDEAIKNLAWLRAKDQSDDNIVGEIERLKNAELLHQEMPKAPLLKIVRNESVVRPLRLLVVILLVQPLSGNFAVVSFATSIFARANTTWSPEYLGLFISGVQLVGTFVSTNTIERCGRKPLMLTSLLLISCCMGSLATWFLLVSYSVPVPDWLPIAAVAGSIFSYGLGLLGLPGILMAEIFSFQYRARLAGIAIVLSWSMASLVLFGFMPLANLLGESTCFYVFCCCPLLGAVFVMYCMPETKGKSYEQIDAAFRGVKWQDDKCDGHKS